MAAEARTLRLVCISDTHMLHDKLALPPGDVLVHAGDFGNRGDGIEPFNEWLGGLDFEHKVVIAGNQEYAFNDLPPETIQSQVMTNCTYLQDSGATVAGVRFWGSPWQPSRNMAFSCKRRRLHEHWAKIPDEVDVLITHMPPFGLCDAEEGCQALAETVQGRVRPALHVCGHVHHARGWAEGEGGVTVVNAACRVAKSSVLRGPTVVDVTLSPGERPSVRVVSQGGVVQALCEVA